MMHQLYQTKLGSNDEQRVGVLEEAKIIVEEQNSSSHQTATSFIMLHLHMGIHSALHGRTNFIGKHFYVNLGVFLIEFL